VHVQVMMAESGNAPVREAMARLERRFEQDKITALGRDTTTHCCQMAEISVV
jgi:hypothetical protein